MVYAIAQLKITDRAAYDRYQAKFMGVMKRFQGRVLVADEKPQVIEGDSARYRNGLAGRPHRAGHESWFARRGEFVRCLPRQVGSL